MVLLTLCQQGHGYMLAAPSSEDEAQSRRFSQLFIHREQKQERTILEKQKLRFIFPICASICSRHLFTSKLPDL